MRVSCLFLVTFGLIASLAPAPLVHAQNRGTGGGSGGSGAATAGQPTKADFAMRLLRDKGENDWSVFSDFEQKYYFNNARCVCEAKVRLELFFSTAGAAKKAQFNVSKATIEVLIGDAACLSDDPTTLRGARCRVLGNLTLGAFARSGDRPTFDFPASYLFGPEGNACQTQGSQSIRLRVDTNGDAIPDLNGDAAPSLTVEYDGQPPAPPAKESITVVGGNEALSVSWDQTEGIADFRGYTVFCSRGENLQVFKPSSYANQFHTKQTACGDDFATGLALSATGSPELAAALAATTDLDGGTQDNADATAGDEMAGANKALGPFSAPPPFTTLNPNYACSDLLRTQRSTRITGLQNNIPYLVGVATVDLHGNASPITTVYLQKPVATRDFFNGYKQAGGEAPGGFCSLAHHRRNELWGVTPVLAFALTGLVLRGFARRRHKS